MVDLVFQNKNHILCTSKMVAEKFKKKHATVLSVIEKLLEENKEFRVIGDDPYFSKKEEEYRGQKYFYYEMDKKSFVRLVMRFRGREAYIWQGKFIDAFFQMEKMLLQVNLNQQSEQWKLQREQSKQIRLEETDIIKQFVDYATNQGSQKAKFYYKHVTTAVYKCLGLIQFKQPKLRETLDLMQTHQLILAEATAKESLLKHMQEGEHYKTIFVLVKQDLERLANVLLIKKI